VTATPTATSSPTATAPPCGADSWEPNDTFETGYFVFPGTLLGLICPSTDVDYFRFSANQYQRIILDLNGLPADYNLRLWNPDGSLLEQSIQTGTTPEQIVIFAPYTGSYRAQVYPVTGQWNATEAYDLHIQVLSATPAGTATHTLTPTRTPTAGTATPAATLTGTVTPTLTRSPTPGPSLTPPNCGADSWEPNDTLGTAAFVWPGRLQGLICPVTDVDFFAFSARHYDTILLDLDGLPADYNLRLWRPDGGLLAQSVHVGIQAEQIACVAPGNGSYGVEVWPASGQWHESSSYTLRVQVSSTTPRVYLPIMVRNQGL